MDLNSIFKPLGLTKADIAGGELAVRTPIDGSEIARVKQDTADTLDAKIAKAVGAFEANGAPSPGHAAAS